MLWFAAPPLNQPRAKGPRHSLAYLQFVAAKRKGASNEDGGGQGDANGVTTKKARLSVAPTVMETMRDVWKEMSIDG